MSILVTAAAISLGGLEPVRVEFQSGGEWLVGSLYVPVEASRGKRLPAIVVAGTWTSVKEQMADRYARRLASKGFVTLAFDFRNFGESGGKPRQLESAKLKAEDIRNAAEFLRSRPEVNPVRIGGLGVCASAGYIAKAIAEGAPIHSFVTVAAWLHDPKSLELAYGGPEGIARRLLKSDNAEAKFKGTGEVEYVPSQSSTDPAAAMPFPLDFYENPARGNRSEWTNKFAVMGWREWLTFDMIALASRIEVPTLMLHSEKAAFPDNVRRFAAGLAGPREVQWSQGEQTDFYDRDPQVTAGVDAAARHFSRTLRSESEREAIQDQAMAGVREFFAALEARDVERFLRVWAEDGVQLMPYSPDGFPKRLEGKAAIRNQYAPLPTNFEWMKFPLARLVPTEDPNVVLAEFNGDIKVKGTGGKYDNTYVGVFDFEGGKLKRYTEYFDPRLLTRAFAIPESDEVAIRQVVDQVGAFADTRDWEPLTKLFADKVRIDYTSLAGGEPAEITPTDLVAGWKTGFARFVRTQHLVAKHRIEVKGDEAECHSEVTATHIKAADEKSRWTCGGKYVHKLSRVGGAWRVTAMTFQLEWEQGER